MTYTIQASIATHDSQLFYIDPIVVDVTNTRIRSILRDYARLARAALPTESASYSIAIIDPITQREVATIGDGSVGGGFNTGSEMLARIEKHLINQ